MPLTVDFRSVTYSAVRAHFRNDWLHLRTNPEPSHCVGIHWNLLQFAIWHQGANCTPPKAPSDQWIKLSRHISQVKSQNSSCVWYHSTSNYWIASGGKNEYLQGHSGLSTICLWTNKKKERAVEFLYIIRSTSSDFCSDVIYQLRYKFQIEKIQHLQKSINADPTVCLWGHTIPGAEETIFFICTWHWNCLVWHQGLYKVPQKHEHVRSLFCCPLVNTGGKVVAFIMMWEIGINGKETLLMFANHSNICFSFPFVASLLLWYDSSISGPSVQTTVFDGLIHTEMYTMLFQSPA